MRYLVHWKAPVSFDPAASCLTDPLTHIARPYCCLGARPRNFSAIQRIDAARVLPARGLVDLECQACANPRSHPQAPLTSETRRRCAGWCWTSLCSTGPTTPAVLGYAAVRRNWTPGRLRAGWPGAGIPLWRADRGPGAVNT